MAIGVFVVGDINVWRAALPCVGECVLKIVELHASLPCRREDARSRWRSREVKTSEQIFAHDDKCNRRGYCKNDCEV